MPTDGDAAVAGASIVASGATRTEGTLTRPECRLKRSILSPSEFAGCPKGTLFKVA